MKTASITLIWGVLTSIIIGLFIFFYIQANESALAKTESVEQNLIPGEPKDITETKEVMVKTIQLIDQGLQTKGYKDFGDISMEYHPNKPSIHIYTSIQSLTESDDDLGDNIEKSVNNILESKEGKLLLSENQSFNIHVYGKGGKKIN